MARQSTSVQKTTSNGDIIEMERVLNILIEDYNRNISATKIERETWINWVPTWTNLTVGNGVQEFEQINLGNTLFFRGGIQFGSTTAITGSVGLSYPLPPRDYLDVLTDSVNPTGRIVCRDDSVPATYPGTLSFESTSLMRLQVQNSAGTYLTNAALSSTVPFTWATDDGIYVWGFYELA